MNDCGNVNAQVNAEKCTGNDSVCTGQGAFARFSTFFLRLRRKKSVRKTDADDDVATAVNFSYRKSRRPKIKAPRNMHALQTRGKKNR